MEFVATLIAAEPGRLDDTTVLQTRSALDALGADTLSPDWLADGLACDIGFGNLSPDQAGAAVTTALGDRPIDAIAQASAGRRKGLLLADMDSTIVTSETLDDLAAFAGIGAEIAAITARAMRGELDFESALKERVGKLKGLSESVLEEAYKEVEISKGAETLVRTMAAQGAYTALVSGGFRYFTSRVRDRLGFHLDQSNEFIIKNGKLTGKVIEPILDRDSKLKTLIALAKERGLALSDTMTVGDGANDLDMTQAAGMGVAYRGKPLLREAARARLDHADLTGLLYAQGYRQDEFVTG